MFILLHWQTPHGGKVLLFQIPIESNGLVGCEFARNEKLGQFAESIGAGKHAHRAALDYCTGLKMIDAMYTRYNGFKFKKQFCNTKQKLGGVVLL